MIRLDHLVGPSVNIDWRAYFADFSASHGGDPVNWKNRLLFRDGWTYSGTSHQGPEWPPPEKAGELWRLKQYYWKARRLSLLRQAKALRLQLTDLEQLANIKSRPLPLSLMVFDREKNQPRRESMEVGEFLSRYRPVLEALEMAIKECQEEMGDAPTPRAR